MGTSAGDGVLVSVRVQPRGARDEIAGWREGALAVRVTAPPVEGEANRAVARLLARTLGIRVSAVSIVRGERGRDKVVRIAGLGRPELEARLGAPPGVHPRAVTRKETRR